MSVDTPRQDDGTIEAACDDLRMALQDLASNGPNADDLKRVKACLQHLHDIANLLGAAS